MTTEPQLAYQHIEFWTRGNAPVDETLMSNVDRLSKICQHLFHKHRSTLIKLEDLQYGDYRRHPEKSFRGEGDRPPSARTLPRQIPPSAEWSASFYPVFIVWRRPMFRRCFDGAASNHSRRLRKNRQTSISMHGRGTRFKFNFASHDIPWLAPIRGNWFRISQRKHKSVWTARRHIGGNNLLLQRRMQSGSIFCLAKARLHRTRICRQDTLSNDNWLFHWDRRLRLP